jgi:MFS family permease
MGLVPVYINELSPKEIVGSFGVFTQLFQNIGVVFSYLLGLILYSSGLNGDILWRIMFGANILTISTTILCIYF